MHNFSRLISISLVVIFIIMTGFSFVVTVYMLNTTEMVNKSVQLNDLYWQVRYDISSEESLERKYRLERLPDAKTMHHNMATDLIGALQEIATMGDATDRALASRVLSLHSQYLAATKKMFAAVDAHNDAEVLNIDHNEVDPVFQQIEQQISKAASSHAQSAKTDLRHLRHTQNILITITPLVFIIGLILLAILYGILRIHRHRIDKALQTELQLLEEQNILKEQQRKLAEERSAQAMQVQQQMSAAYEQQRRLNQLKDQFIANVNHELRTPLTAVYGYAELLSLPNNDIDEEMRSIFLNNLRNASQDLMQLIDQVLEATRVSYLTKPPQCEEVNVSSAVQTVLNHLDPREIQSHTINHEIPHDLTVWADPQYLQQILRNLLSNAFKYTPDGCPISISAERQQVGGPDTENVPHVSITVKDNGPGIPPEEISLLFQKFSRLTRNLSTALPGTGLGLYISKQLVEAMGGRIWVESTGRPGEGSCFCFLLPTVPSPSHEPVELVP